MYKNKRLNNILIMTSIVTTMGFTNLSNAEIYKWHDNRGVIQYSDIPPKNSMKFAPNEIVKPAHIKDFCPPGAIVKHSNQQRTINSNKNSYFFNIFKQPIKNNNTLKNPIIKATTNYKSQTNNSQFFLNGINFKNLIILAINKSKPPAPLPTTQPIVTPPAPTPVNPTVPTVPVAPVVTTPPNNNTNIFCNDLNKAQCDDVYGGLILTKTADSCTAVIYDEFDKSTKTYGAHKINNNGTAYCPTSSRNTSAQCEKTRNAICSSSYIGSLTYEYNNPLTLKVTYDNLNTQ